MSMYAHVLIVSAPTYSIIAAIRRTEKKRYRSWHKDSRQLATKPQSAN